MKTKGLSLALLGITWLCAPAAAFELTDSITGGLDPVITMEKDDSGVTENEVLIDMQGDPRGVYTIELRNKETIVDTKKIMLK